MTTTTVRLGKRVFRVPEAMIKAKEIIDETSDLYRIVLSDIGAEEPERYETLFYLLENENMLSYITFTNGLYSIKLCNVLITRYVYHYGTMYEFETDTIKEIK